MIPGFENGVSSFGGGWAMVGEAGPELVNLPGGSNVVPNHQLGSVMGGSGDIHFHPGAIDARGSTDPAQTSSMIQQAIKNSAPHIVAASQQKSAEHIRRTPASMRR